MTSGSYARRSLLYLKLYLVWQLPVLLTGNCSLMTLDPWYRAVSSPLYLVWQLTRNPSQLLAAASHQYCDIALACALICAVHTVMFAGLFHRGSGSL